MCLIYQQNCESQQMLFRARQQTSWTGRDIASCHDFPLKSFHLLSILLCLLAPSFHLPLKFPVIPLNSHGFHEFKRYSQPQLPLCSPLFGSSIPLLRLAGADSVPAVTRLLTDVTQQQSADEDDKCQNGSFVLNLILMKGRKKICHGRLSLPLAHIL